MSERTLIEISGRWWQERFTGPPFWARHTMRLSVDVPNHHRECARTRLPVGIYTREPAYAWDLQFVILENGELAMSLLDSYDQPLVRYARVHVTRLWQQFTFQVYGNNGEPVSAPWWFRIRFPNATPDILGTVYEIACGTIPVDTDIPEAIRRIITLHMLNTDVIDPRFGGYATSHPGFVPRGVQREALYPWLTTERDE